MRKLKLQVQMTVDGYIAGPKWRNGLAGAELGRCIETLCRFNHHAVADCIVLPQQTRRRVHSTLGCGGCRSS